MKALVDTCVIIDALQNRVPFYEDSQKIFYAVANNQVKGYISAKSVTDIYYITHRATHDDSATRKILITLLNLFDVLDTEAMDCRRALLSETSDYEDAVMIETAARENVDCIVTRNVKDYGKSVVSIFSPSEFLAKLNEE